jgi:uncharacterized membrane protein
MEDKSRSIDGYYSRQGVHSLISNHLARIFIIIIIIIVITIVITIIITIVTTILITIVTVITS